MKKLILLTLSSFLFACSSGGDGDNNSNDGCPIDFECSTATANDFLSLEQVGEDYQSYVNAYGEPISEGLYQDMDGAYSWRWVWIDANANGDEVCLNVSCSDCSYGIIGGCGF
ncbi:hypothetical protein OAM52_05055, partial [Flavobacteriaceae bacterium]|nr:hypothetical protein [Flavobacteriaceae bacterium]